MRLPRPSAPLVVSFLALFVALGGVSWAAIHLPRDSVGNAQLRPLSVGNAQLQPLSVGNAKLRPNSVGSRKIIPGSVGVAQVNSSQVQLRVAGPCSGGAMQSIAVSGDVTCTPVLPNEYGGTAQSVTLGTGSTPVVSKSLPLGFSYLVTADANVHLSETASGAQSVFVQCALGLLGTGQTVGSGTSGDFTVELDPTNFGQSSGTIPLTLATGPSSALPAVGVSCSDLPAGGGAAPTATVNATIDAIQTASNN
jgi:hypothetical protein